jgi:quercetin dioxygenase-like cupin family protein
LGVSARSGVGAAGLALVGCGDDDDDSAVADAFAGRNTPRRVVTGIDADGASYFVHDGETPGHLNDGFFVQDALWIDNPRNPDPEATLDPAEDPTPLLSGGTQVPVGGSTFGLLTFKAGGGAGMHTTRTIDYGIVLSGEIDLELDEDEVHLIAGDVVVQRGTRHAWHNRTDQDCVMAFILISSANYA